VDCIVKLFLTAAAVLLCLPIGVPATATPVYPGGVVVSPDSKSLEDRRRFTIQLMHVAPLPTDQPVSAPELANPLHLDREIALRTFGREVHYSDLLASSMIPDPDPLDLELPPGALRGIDILDDLDSLYLSYDGRAFDKAVLDIGDAKIIDKKGVPVTTDGSPLSLGDFGVLIRARKN